MPCVARISELIFHSEPELHTVAYDAKARKMVTNFANTGRGLPLAYGKDINDCVVKLQEVLTRELAKAELRTVDFGFRVSHSEVSEEGTFREVLFSTTIGSEFEL